jgi:ADP-ribose pyrophosphatase YjhB (NUDIX family)
MSSKMSKISFDFDNTIAMSYMTYDGEQPIPVFQSYNDKIIKKIKKHIKENDDIYIVTARTEDLEQYFPEQTVESHLEKLGLKEYFWPDRVIFTAGGQKVDILHDLGVEKHYDDAIEEHFDGLNAKYKVIQPLDDFKDGDTVGKVVIYDNTGRILILKRSDEGHLWDLPGGHVKNVEIARGPEGVDDGTEREVFEETGIMVPFLKGFMVYDFLHKGITHKIHMFFSQIEESTPHIRLDLQDQIENIDYKWATLDELEGKMTKATTNLRKAFDEVSMKDKIFEENEPFQLAMKKKHRIMKKKLLGLGNNKHFGGGKGHSKPNYSRSRSAPPMGESIGDEKWPKKYFREIKLIENDEKSKKKVKIKIKKVEMDVELEEKRKKRRKKRKKSTKKHYHWNVDHWFYGGGYGDGGDSGGNGGE